MISAKEAQRLTKTRWQAELTKLEKLVKKAIYSNVYFVEYIGALCPATIEYLKNLGYKVIVNNNQVLIDWSCEE